MSSSDEYELEDAQFHVSHLPILKITRGFPLDSSSESDVP